VPTAHPVPAATVHPLRTRVLRPTWPAGRLLTLSEDDAPGTVHVAAEAAGSVVGVGTVFVEPPPASLRGEVPGAAYVPGAAWVLRGVATDESVRGGGYGRAVLDACVAAARAGGGGFLWCVSRLGAVPFYERAGMVTAGDPHEIAEIGPHVVMWGPI
jgi:GNAT superfamily N-acetyltransferase